MSYFDHRRLQPTEPAENEPALAYPVDEDGDRLYTEEDYAVAPDGDAFVPDDAEADPTLVQPMPFTYQGSYDTLLMTDDDPPIDDNDPLPEEYYDEELLTEEELADLRRSHWRLLSMLADFGGVIVGTAVILLLVALLVSLCNWLIADVSQSFILLQTHL